MNFYKVLNKEIKKYLSENDKYIHNQWAYLDVNLNDKQVLIEAMVTDSCKIKVRRPLQKKRVNSKGQEIWVYFEMQFTNNICLKGNGFVEYIKLDQDEENSFGKLA